MSREEKEALLAQEKYWWRMLDSLRQVQTRGKMAKCQKCGALNPNPQKGRCWQCDASLLCPVHSAEQMILSFDIDHGTWRCPYTGCPLNTMNAFQLGHSWSEKSESKRTISKEELRRREECEQKEREAEDESKEKEIQEKKVKTRDAAYKKQQKRQRQKSSTSYQSPKQINSVSNRWLWVMLILILVVLIIIYVLNHP